MQTKCRQIVIVMFNTAFVDIIIRVLFFPGGITQSQGYAVWLCCNSSGSLPFCIRISGYILHFFCARLQGCVKRLLAAHFCPSFLTLFWPHATTWLPLDGFS
jgi:hypothetical protein